MKCDGKHLSWTIQYKKSPYNCCSRCNRNQNIGKHHHFLHHPEHHNTSKPRLGTLLFGTCKLPLLPSDRIQNLS